MIKEVEHNDGESRLKGHVEVLKQMDGTFTVTQYVEDKKYGVPWEFVSPEDVVNIADRQLKGVGKVLKKMAENYRSKNTFTDLEDHGFSAP